MPKLKFVDEIPRKKTFRHIIPEWDTLEAYLEHKSKKPIVVGEYDSPEQAQHKANTLRAGQEGRFGRIAFKISTRRSTVYAEKTLA